MLLSSRPGEGAWLRSPSGERGGAARRPFCQRSLREAEAAAAAVTGKGRSAFAACWVLRQASRRDVVRACGRRPRPRLASAGWLGKRPRGRRTRRRDGGGAAILGPGLWGDIDVVVAAAAATAFLSPPRRAAPRDALGLSARGASRSLPGALACKVTPHAGRASLSCRELLLLPPSRPSISAGRQAGPPCIPPSRKPGP